MSNNKQKTIRPWGSFTVLEDLRYTKVKRLVIDPGHRLSLQRHRLRDEHWVIVRGTATVTLDDQTFECGYGEQVFVKRGALHRIANNTAEPVEIIEVQIGDAFPEEDIERFEDDYNRQSPKTAHTLK